MTLFLYILRDYLKFVVGTIVLTVFLFILFDAIHQSSKDFAEYSPSAWVISRYYLYQVPGQVVQALPIATLLSSVITMILLNRSNEITAMRAAGMSAWQVGRPLAYGGLGLSVVALIVGEVWAPKFAKKVHYIQEVEIQGARDEQASSAVKWFRSGRSLVNFQDFDPITQTLAKIQIVDIGEGFRPRDSLQAVSGSFSSESGRWTLHDIKVLKFKANSAVERLERVANVEIQLPIEPAKLKKDRRRPNELSFAELRELVERGKRSGADTVAYSVELQGKVAYPFAAFVVSLIGLKFGYRSERSTETARGVLLAFFIGISYWFVMSATRALGLQGAIGPVLAAWSPNLVILSIIGLDAWASRKL